MRKPDFIIIGAMKSATSTLHTQLSLQSGIFMTTPKEPNYFSDDEEYARGERWYGSLFSKAKSSDLCGESSTHYTKLPTYPLTVERMARSLENPKLIYVMRHPIDRLVSHYMHQWSQNIIKCDINEAIDQYPELINYSRYAMQLQPYFDEFGMQNVLPVFSEKLSVSPGKQLNRVAGFIGYEGSMEWHYDLKQQNVSKERIRAFPGYAFFIQSNAMTWLRRRFIPQFVRNKIKKQLTMNDRPVIADYQLHRLTDLFNSDLKQLSPWLGADVSCDNYKEVVTNNSLICSNAKSGAW